MKCSIIARMNTSSSIQIRTNLKSLPRKKREEFRNRLFALFEQGTKAYTAARLLHLNLSCVHKLFTRFKTEGSVAIFEQKRGPTSSVRQILSNEEKGELAHAITKCSPNQLLFDFALWSSKVAASFYRNGRPTAVRLKEVVKPFRLDLGMVSESDLAEVASYEVKIVYK